MEAIIAQKNITAPFAGRLGLRRVEKGQYVKGQALVWLQSLDPIWIDFPVPEGDLGKLKDRRSPIELAVNAYPGQVFKGEIEAFDARVAQDTRTLMVRGGCPTPTASCCLACSPTWPCSQASRRSS